jgi:hypothetical protein
MDKKIYYYILGAIILIVIFGMFLILRGNEDSWIKNSMGVYIKHGNPSKTPIYVKEQQDAINCAKDLYSQAKNNGIVFNSQCLGACSNYSVDIVHVPRNPEDDKLINQCKDYPRVTPDFIELDSNGVIVRVA